MLTIKDAVRVINSIELTAQKVESSKFTLSDIMILGEISPEIKNNMLLLQKWFNGEDIIPDTTVSDGDSTNMAVGPMMGELVSILEPYRDIEPESDWRYVFDLDLYVSDKGTIYSMKKHAVLKTYFIDGDLRVFLSEDELSRRASAIVCKAFAIHSLNRNCNYIIHYNDGDRRNISPYNLSWVEKDSSYNIKRFYIEDICRRIVEFNGDVDKILKQYEGSKPITTRRGVEMIISKELHPGLSDEFFYNIDGRIVPVDSNVTESSKKESDKSTEGFDVGGFFLETNDKKLTLELIRDKIKSGQVLNPVEEVIIIFSTMESIGGKRIPDVKKIANTIKNQFNITIPFEIIDQVRNDFNSDIAKVFRN